MVKFDHFEIGIVYHLPCTQELDGVSGTNPVLDDVGSTAFALLAIGHVCQGNVVFVNLTSYILHLAQSKRYEKSI